MRWLFVTLLLVLACGLVGAAEHARFGGFSAAEDFTIAGNIWVTDTAVYKTSYYSVNGGSWQSFTLQGVAYGGSDDWLTGTVTHALPASLAEPGEHYVIVYSCSGNGQAWDCHGGKWQLQIINVAPAATCSDGEQNQNEEAVDCGGPNCPACLVIPQGLIHWWKFDGDATDSVGSADGTRSGTSFVNGKMDQALSFDGTDDRVDVGSFSVGGDELTIAAWVKSDNLANPNCPYSGCRIISKTTGVLNEEHYWMISTLNYGGQKFRFRIKTGGVTSELVTSSGDDIQNNMWTHVAAVYDGSEMIVYKDGVSMYSMPKTGNIDTNDAVPVGIGDNVPPAGSLPWDGAIDDVRIYDVALSAAEVLDLYNAREDIVDCVGDGDCTADYAGTDYCHNGDVYHDWHDFSCDQGSCNEATTSRLVETCGGSSCRDGACLDMPSPENGVLEVSDNDRYIQHADGTPFLWIGGTAWGMFTRGSREDVRLYLDNRKAKGINVIQSVVHWPVDALGDGRESKFGIKNPVNVYGHRPFNGGEDNPDPTSPAIVPGGSPDNPNDYWDHVDFVVREARDRGMYLGLVTVWAPSLIDGEDGTEHIVYDTPEKSRSFGQFLGSRYKDEPHIIWIVTGHTDPVVYHPDVFSRPIHRAMAEGIVAGVTGDTPAWNENHSAWDQVLMTGHPNGMRSISRFFGADDVWLDIYMSQPGQRTIDLHRPYELTAADYDLTDPVRPAVNGEGAYEGCAFWAEASMACKTALLARRTAYHTFFAGGAGYTYGHEESCHSGCYDGVWGFCGPNNDGSWKNNLDAPGAHDLSHLRDLLSDNEWWLWQPSQGSITAGKSSGATIKAAIKSSDNERMLVYYPDRTGATIRNDLGRTATANWFDPRNGDTSPAANFGIGEKSYTPPSGWEDAVLVLE